MYGIYHSRTIETFANENALMVHTMIVTHWHSLFPFLSFFLCFFFASIRWPLVFLLSRKCRAEQRAGAVGIRMLLAKRSKKGSMYGFWGAMELVFLLVYAALFYAFLASTSLRLAAGQFLIMWPFNSCFSRTKERESSWILNVFVFLICILDLYFLVSFALFYVHVDKNLGHQALSS